MALFQNVAGTPLNPAFAEIKAEIPITLASGAVYLAQNIWHVRRQTGSTAVTLAAIGTAFATLVDTELAAAMSVSAGAGQLYGRWLDSPTFGWETLSALSAGSVSGDSLPNLTTVTMQLKSGIRGRSYNGSKHFAGIAESSTTKDKLNSTGISLWDAVRDSLEVWMVDADNAGSGFGMCVISQVLSDQVSDPCVFTGADVTDIKLNVIIGTMRRRRERVGPAQ